MSLPASYFEPLYAADPDPWGFTRRWYEERKRAVTLASLPEPRYRRAYEPGCSIGVLTEALATRCDLLLATDVSAAALVAAGRRLAGTTGVRLEQWAVPGDWPGGRFDLVVLSEVLYYLDDDDLWRTAVLAATAVAPGGTLLAAHWRHPVADYPQSGDAAQSAVAEAAGSDGLVPLVHHHEDDFDLAVYRRPGGEVGGGSVAARSGLC